KGDLVFDATRLYFENVSAESGGGTLHLSGTVNYAETPLRYDVNVRSDRVRIRYPEGMSWLAGGTLRLTGTPTAAVLSGRVMIERVTLAQASKSRACSSRQRKELPVRPPPRPICATCSSTSKRSPRPMPVWNGLARNCRPTPISVCAEPGSIPSCSVTSIFFRAI